MKILIIGHKGMLGSDIMKSKLHLNHSLIGIDRSECDIVLYDQVYTTITSIKPDLMINCSAYTAVDLCESKEGSLVNAKVNIIGVRNIAKVSKKYEIPLIHISTDYVFDGSQDSGYNTGDPTDPLNMYGMAKLLGEYTIQDNSDLYHIIRTSWLYGGGPEHTNFVKTMVKLMREKDEIKVVHDQYGAPTSTETLIQHIINIINNNELGGIISHCTDKVEKAITWFEFASEIKNIIGSSCNISACDSSEFPRPAVRPKYSLLLCKSEGFDRRDGVKMYIKSNPQIF